MLVKWLFLYLFFLLAWSALYLLSRRERRRNLYFRLISWFVWLPAVLLILALFFLWLGEGLRSWKLSGYQESRLIADQTNEFLSRFEEAPLTASGEHVCIYPSYDIDRIEKQNAELSRILNGKSYPAEDGVWYVFHISKKSLTKTEVIYFKAPRLGCFTEKLINN